MSYLVRTFLTVSMAVLAAAGCGASRGEVRRSALQAMVESERAFARSNAVSGQRAAWLEWFAPDGVMFRRDGPVNARAFMSGDPQPPPAPPGAFDWRPVYGDVSHSGDLGYNTGPVRVAGMGRSVSWFFSIWRREPDATWRVVVDLGTPVDTAGPDPFDSSFTAAREVRTQHRCFPVMSGSTTSLVCVPSDHRYRRTMADELLRLDSTALDSTEMFLALLDHEVRGLRLREPPLVGIEAFRAALARRAAPVHHLPAGGGVSEAGDLGYTFGRYLSADGGRGSYARVWRRDRRGAWRIVYDVARPEVQPG